MRVRCVAGLLSSALSTACAPEVALESWQRVDVSKLERALDEPSGSVNDVDGELVERLVGVNAGLEDFSTVVTAFLDAFEPSDVEPADDTERENTPSQGAAVYVRWSCPGADMNNPVRDFSEGSVIVDSPGLDKESAEQLRISGDLLLTAEDCRVGDFIYRGRAPAFYRTSGEVILFVDFGLEVEEITSGAKLDFAGPIEFLNAELRYLTRIASDSTLTIAFDIEALDFSVIGVDGRLHCNPTISMVCEAEATEAEDRGGAAR